MPQKADRPGRLIPIHRTQRDARCNFCVFLLFWAFDIITMPLRGIHSGTTYGVPPLPCRRSHGDKTVT
jgi:hypothetical protein